MTDTPDLLQALPLSETQRLFPALHEVLQAGASQGQAWQASLEGIERRLRESVIRVAVVGTVKAGKSSFLNALLERDWLKRGAGIITSMITRVRYAQSARAHLRFKAQAALDAEFREAWGILRQAIDSDLPLTLDWRNPEQAQALQAALHQSRLQFSERYDSLDRHQIFLELLLAGYQTAAPHLGLQENEWLLNEADLQKHQEFVGRDELAVYLRDMVLECPQAWHPALEIADCQGSDSPNPAHFARVQEYLSQASLVLYVISTRTGIRQADLLLLRALEQLGLLEKTWFVINADFSEHENLADWQRVARQTLADLRRWQPQPRVFEVSALFQLYHTWGKGLPARQRAQYQLWQASKDLVKHHHHQWQALQKALQEHLQGGQWRALVQAEHAHWQRLLLNIQRFLSTTQHVWASDQAQLQNLSGALEAQQVLLRQALQAFQTTLNGTLSQVTEQIKHDLNQLFQPGESEVWRKLEAFVTHYEPSLEAIPEGASASAQVALLYQEMQHQLLRFVAEELNGGLIQQLRLLQEGYLEALRVACRPYLELTQAALEKYGQLLQFLQTSAPLPRLSLPNTGFPEVPLVAFSTTLRYDFSSQAQNAYLLAKSWFQGQMNTWLKGRKPPEDSPPARVRFTAENLRSLKQHLREALEFDVNNYRENLKYLYLQQGLKQWVEATQRDLQQQIEGALIDFRDLLESASRLRNLQQSLTPKVQALLEQVQSLLRQGSPGLLGVLPS